MRMGYTMQPLAEPADAVSYLASFPDARRIADEDAHVDVGYSFIVMHEGHASEIPACVRECGVTSFKFFLTYPTVSEWGKRVGMPLFPGFISPTGKPWAAMAMPLCCFPQRLKAERSRPPSIWRSRFS